MRMPGLGGETEPRSKKLVGSDYAAVRRAPSLFHAGQEASRRMMGLEEWSDRWEEGDIWLLLLLMSDVN